jgi:hypothetical protein
LVPPTIEWHKGTSYVKSEGKTIRFSGGQYITSDEEEQKLLEASPMFGSDFFDLLRQENEAKAAQAKSAKSLAAIVEGARRTDTQIRGPEAPEPAAKAEPEQPAEPVAPKPAKKPRAKKAKK